MKLATVSRGPVTLRKINYAPNLSRETYAFSAEVTLGTATAVVDNDGGGGPNFVRDQTVERLIDAYARTQTYRYGGIDRPLDGDTLISLLVEDAIHAHEEQKRERKRVKAMADGLLVRITAGDYAGHEAVIKREGRLQGQQAYLLTFLDHPTIHTAPVVASSVEKVRA